MPSKYGERKDKYNKLFLESHKFAQPSLRIILGGNTVSYNILTVNGGCNVTSHEDFHCLQSIRQRMKDSAVELQDNSQEGHENNKCYDTPNSIQQ